MKKTTAYLTVLALMLIGGTALAQEKTAHDEKSAIANGIEQTLDVIGKKTGEAMDAVAVRFGPGAEYTFNALVGYYTRLGYVLLFATLLLISVQVWLLQRGRFYLMKYEKDGAASATIEGAGGGHCIAAFFMLGATIPCAYYAILYCSGPERHAILVVKALLGL